MSDRNDSVWCEGCQCDRRYTVNGAGMYICCECGMDITPDGRVGEEREALLKWMEEVTHATIGQPNWREVRRALVEYKAAAKMGGIGHI